MPGKDWDELDLANERPASAPPKAAAPKPSGRRARLGWLVALLFAAGGAATAGLELDQQLDERALLARARDEAAVERRWRFVAEDKVLVVEKARAAERARAARLASLLRPTLDPKDGQVAAAATSVTVTLADEALFARAEAELSAHGKETLARLGAALKDVTDQTIVVGGYSEETLRSEKFPSNWELSAARAVSVLRFLVETAGVDPHRASAAGYAEFHPREAGGGKNHRIEIVLMPIVLPPPPPPSRPQSSPTPSPR